MIDILQEAAKAGGNVLIHYFRKEFTTSFKSSHQDIVTQADTESQKVIQDTIVDQMTKKGFKKEDIGFLGEENLLIEGRHQFIIDPLDGTANFASGIPHFCVTMAYAVDGAVMAGIVYNPITGVSYYAERGHGAWKLENGHKSRLHVEPRLMKDTIAEVYLTNRLENIDQAFNIAKAILPKVRKVRYFGSAALGLAMYCDNLFSIVVDTKCFIWDIAAASLMIEEAGGSLVDFDGNAIEFKFDDPSAKYQIIATHQDNLDSILKIIQSS